jgi:hypothetical protein
MVTAGSAWIVDQRCWPFDEVIIASGVIFEKFTYWILDIHVRLQLDEI